jgi:hypothetical protein
MRLPLISKFCMAREAIRALAGGGHYRYGWLAMTLSIARARAEHRRHFQTII